MNYKHERIITGAAFVFFTAVMVAIAAMTPPLGHDEAAYAIGGLGMIGDAPSTGYPLYRSIGTALIAALPAAVGHDLAFRLTGLAVALITLILFWRFACRVVGDRAAAYALFAVATSFLAMRRGWEVLSDFPSTALLIGVAWVLIRELNDRDAPGWGLLWVAPLAAAAFYARYGSVLALPVLAVAAVWAWPRAMLARPLIPLATLALFVTLLVPHMLVSIEHYDSPWGLLLRARVAHEDGGIGRGFLLMIRKLPRVGIALGALAGVGLAVGVAAVRRRSDRVAAFLWTAAAGHLLLICLRGYAEPRYVLFDLFVLAALGARWLNDRLQRVSSHVTTAVVVLFVANALVGGAFALSFGKRRTDDRQVLVTAAARIRAVAGGRCGLLSTRVPQMSWYSRCETRHLGSPPRPNRDRKLRTKPKFVLILDGRRRTPPSVERSYAIRSKPPETLASPGRNVRGARLYQLQ